MDMQSIINIVIGLAIVAGVAGFLYTHLKKTAAPAQTGQPLWPSPPAQRPGAAAVDVPVPALAVPALVPAQTAVVEAPVAALAPAAILAPVPSPAVVVPDAPTHLSAPLPDMPHSYDAGLVDAEAFSNFQIQTPAAISYELAANSREHAQITWVTATESNKFPGRLTLAIIGPTPRTPEPTAANAGVLALMPGDPGRYTLTIASERPLNLHVKVMG